MNLIDKIKNMFSQLKGTFIMALAQIGLAIETSIESNQGVNWWVIAMAATVAGLRALYAQSQNLGIKMTTIFVAVITAAIQFVSYLGTFGDFLSVQHSLRPIIISLLMIITTLNSKPAKAAQ